jgi:hypothetical protein
MNKKRITAKKSIILLVILTVLLLLSACDEVEQTTNNSENTPIETPTPKSIEPETPTIEDNRLGINLYDLVNSCPSESLTYEGNLTNCNLDNLVMFTIVGEIDNPDKFGVLFYASAYNDYQNEQVAEVLNAINSKFFSNYNSTTKDIILEATQSVLNNGEKQYLYRDSYQVQITGSPAQDGGGSIASYYITK